LSSVDSRLPCRIAAGNFFGKSTRALSVPWPEREGSEAVFKKTARQLTFTIQDMILSPGSQPLSFKRPDSIPIPNIHISTSGNQELDHLFLACSSGAVQRRVSIFTYSIDMRTVI
jgi:hypothetical protein